MTITNLINFYKRMIVEYETKNTADEDRLFKDRGEIDDRCTISEEIRFREGKIKSLKGVIEDLEHIAWKEGAIYDFPR